jgi:hypothetical protein
MAGPLAGLSAIQIAQQKPPDPTAQQVSKQAPSKFDQALKSTGVERTAPAQQVLEAQKTQHIEQLKKLEPTRFQKLDRERADRSVTGRGMDPVTQKSEVGKTTSMVMGMFGHIEKGQTVLDKLINSSVAGKHFSNSELLGLQAGMYKYSQELDLCSKVVEKATNGLKDTMKTQV